MTINDIDVRTDKENLPRISNARRLVMLLNGTRQAVWRPLLDSYLLFSLNALSEVSEGGLKWGLMTQQGQSFFIAITDSIFVRTVHFIFRRHEH